MGSGEVREEESRKKISGEGMERGLSGIMRESVLQSIHCQHAIYQEHIRTGG